MRDERAEGERWLRQAENDLGLGRVALRERYFAQACFIAQQSAEKALKALAYGAGDRLVIGHSLVELVERLHDRFPRWQRSARPLGSSTSTTSRRATRTGSPAAYPSRRSESDRRARRSRAQRASWRWHGSTSRAADASFRLAASAKTSWTGRIG